MDGHGVYLHRDLRGGFPAPWLPLPCAYRLRWKNIETARSLPSLFYAKAPQENPAVLFVRNYLFIPVLSADGDILLESSSAFSVPS